MITPKKESFNCCIIVAAVFTIVALNAVKTLADNTKALKLLSEASKSAETIDPCETDLIITKLQEALKDCRDQNLRWRLRHKIAVTYFKANQLSLAYAHFKQIVESKKAPSIILTCSWNMLGQICRLQGKNKESLRAFAVFIKRSKRVSCRCKAPGQALCWAYIGRAEIFEVQQNYQDAVNEYQQLLAVLGNFKIKRLQTRFEPLIKDRISQLYLRLGKIDKYLKTATWLRLNYPEYYRTAVINLELESIEFLRGIDPDITFPNGSYGAPAKLIEHFKKSDSNQLSLEFLSKLEKLREQDKETYGGVLVRYHYAWLLDAAGEKEKALKIFTNLSSSKKLEHKSYTRRQTVKTIRAYAGIQSAIMLTEKGLYKKALGELKDVPEFHGDSHIAKLKDSVIEGTKILKREVRR